MFYINKFQTSGDVQTAVDEGTLLKPYVALITNTNVVDYNSYNSIDIDYSKEYLTFNITSAGQIKWFCNNQQTTNLKTIQYSTDNGSNWTSITSNRNAPAINVTTGDKVLFKGDNGTYMGSSNSYYSCFSGSTAGFELEGNIMSLIDSTNFSGITDLPQTYTFQYMFAGCTGLTSAQNLVLPATSLVAGCYRYMFQGCTNLNYIKCLATNITAQGALNSWVDGVASSGTFVKKAGTSWNTGVSGIPEGWTVIDEQ